MTTPDLSFVIPTKWKPWVGAVGALLTFIVPTVTEMSADLPAPGPAVIAAVLAALTWLGIYKVPYAPPGAVLVPEVAVTPEVPAPKVNEGDYRNPWQ